MTIPIDSANIYTDFQGLDELRLSADKRDPKAMEAAAKQFEALFIQQMLKSMRDASLAEGAFDGEESRFYLDMFDKQLSLTMTQGEGIGLAKMIVRQLQSTVKQVEEIKQQQPGLSGVPDQLTGPALQHSLEISKKLAPSHNELSAPMAGEAATSNNDIKQVAGTIDSEIQPDDMRFSTPAEFVQQLWPHAQRIAKVLGVDPKVLIAQSALETGWGKYITRHPDGRSSNNFFNIKADQRWNGETVSLSTLEFREGIPAPEKANFRAYPSLEESFTDYADFIRNSRRYHEALQQASDLEQYTQKLQAAGYATDPEYSNKIMNIINGSPLNQALETVKLSLNETINNRDRSEK